MARKIVDRSLTFNAREGKCPICKKDFRKGCEHSVTQAKEYLHEQYLKKLIAAALKK